MISFFIAIGLLLIGYLVYSRIIEKIIEVDKERETPAIRLRDGVDYVPLPWYKVLLIQLLNITGLGPIFGAIAGALWGPVSFIWIVFGNIFGGAVHDFLSAMLSIRMDGRSLPNIIENTLGNFLKQLVLIFTLLLMILVGAVFIVGPAEILVNTFNLKLNLNFFNTLLDLKLEFIFWVSLIFIYYFIATLLPIDKVIGRIYPFFGFFLFFMALSILFMMIIKGYKIPEVFTNLKNNHYKGSEMPIFPMMFISIACGAISGFHATQSPIMAKCITNEKYARRVFYGAMIIEGVIALIWAAISMSFFGSIEDLNKIVGIERKSAAYIVNLISNTLLGKFGAILAIIGVVIAPITSGDTAFRSARLIIADFFKIPQNKIINRLSITIFLFLFGFFLTQIDYGILWRYMAWSNQSLATITLWAITIYLVKEKKFYLITLLPSLFMTYVVLTYFFFAPETLSMPYNISLILGFIGTFFTFLAFVYYKKNISNG